MPKKVTELKAKQEEVLKELRALDKLATDEKRQLSDDESKKFDDGEQEFETIQRNIDRELRMEAKERNLSAGFEKTPPHLETAASGDGEEERGSKSKSKEKAGSKGMPFRSLGEQLQAVIGAGQNRHSPVDTRLLEVRSPTGMSESVPADGGFLVQQDFMAELSSGAFETGILSQRCRRLPIGSGKNGIKIAMIDETSRLNGSRNGGIQAYWVGEAEQKPQSYPRLRIMELTLKKLVGLIPITDELLQDATALDAWVRMLFSDEFGFQLDEAIVNGSGVGQPLGILNSPAVVEQADEATQAASELLWINIVKMYSRLAPSSMSSAAWFYNSEIFPALATMQFDASATAGNVPLFVPAGGASGSPLNTLLGLPLIPIEQAAALGTPGDLILADFNQYMLIEKGGIETAMSIHVRFEYDESMLRFVMRADGQPMWRAPMTPYKGSLTKSPFVTLALRNGS